MEKTPVSVMPVEVAEHGVDYENIPKMLCQTVGSDKPLLLNGIKNIKLGSGSAGIRNQNRVLYRAEVVKEFPAGCKIAAGAHSKT